MGRRLCPQCPPCPAREVLSLPHSLGHSPGVMGGTRGAGGSHPRVGVTITSPVPASSQHPPCSWKPCRTHSSLVGTLQPGPLRAPPAFGGSWGPFCRQGPSKRGTVPTSLHTLKTRDPPKPGSPQGAPLPPAAGSPPLQQETPQQRDPPATRTLPATGNPPGFLPHPCGVSPAPPRRQEALPGSPGPSPPVPETAPPLTVHRPQSRNSRDPIPRLPPKDFLLLFPGTGYPPPRTPRYQTPPPLTHAPPPSP